MTSNRLILSLLGISLFFISNTVCRESIIDGDVAHPHQFPYQVALIVEPHGLECGGGILKSHLILTAAHCVLEESGEINGRRMWVRAGSNDFENPGVVGRVKKIYVPSEFHPRFNSVGDIAVLRLKEPLHHAHLRHLELPHTDHVNVGEKGKIAGWGWHYVRIHNGHEFGNYTDTMLRYAEATVIQPDQCKQTHPDVKITAKHICARVKQRNLLHPRGVCIGDSGGPLVDESGKHVIGVLSKSPIGCIEEEKPSIYTRVSDFKYLVHHAIHNTTAPNINILELED